MEERHKVLSVAKTFLKYRKEDLERILSDEGIHLRTNRSIQVEGSFGELKQDMQFRRYLSRGTSNVLAESILLIIMFLTSFLSKCQIAHNFYLRQSWRY